MKILIILFLSTFWVTTAEAQNPVAKEQIHWAWKTTVPFLKACLVSDDCPLTATEKDIAFQIIKNEKYYSEKTIQFVSEEERPDLFTSANGEIHRLMVTGLTPDTPIYINSTRALLPAQPIPLENLIGLFAHELVHHLGYQDDELRGPDQFGIQVTSLVKKHLIAIDVSMEKFKIWVFNYPSPIMGEFAQYFPKGLHPEVLLSNDFKFYSQSFTEKIALHGQRICGNSKLWSSLGQVSDYTESKISPSWHLTLETKLTARCFDDKNQTLQEVFYYATSSLEVDQQTEALQMATFRFSKDSESHNSAQVLNVLEVQMPPFVTAGEELKVVAQVEPMQTKKFTGCSATFTSKQWPSPSPQMPLTQTATTCRIVSQVEGKYTLDLTLQIPKNSPQGLSLNMHEIGLEIEGGGFYIGRPRMQQEIQVRSLTHQSFEFLDLQVTNGLKVPSATIKNAFAIPRGAPAKINLRFTNSESILDGEITYMAKNLKGQILKGALTLGNRKNGKIYSIDESGNLIVSIEVDPMDLAPNDEIVMILISNVVALNESFHFLNQNIEDQGLTIAWVVKP